MTNIILEVRQLRKYFTVTKGFFRAKSDHVKAVDGVDFTILKGRTLGLVGESGCGKSTIARLILLLEKATAGAILAGGNDVNSLKGRDLLTYRRSVQAVFQDPSSALNPRMRARDIVAEPIVALGSSSKKLVRERVDECLVKVGLSRTDGARFPHEFSGGQRQRIALARAIAPKPQLIVLDEPISSLDVSIRAQVLNLLLELQASSSISYLMIAHDLAAVKYTSDTIGVMYLGKLVEIGESETLYRNPLHPYTAALLSAALPFDPDAPCRNVIVSGEVPSPINLPRGCRFHPRCPHAKLICREVEPELKSVLDGQKVACHLFD